MSERLFYDGYTLVFEEHFDGAELNRKHWNVELHDSGWVNEELQSYVDSEENIYLQDSNLFIRPVKIKNSDGGISYISGRISTQHKHDFIYGLFEARLKVPKGKGFLPAFWLMATNEERYGYWPCCGEIDIMEIPGGDTKTNYGTIHFGLPHQQSQGIITLKEGDFFDEYHTFALKWEPGILRWYVDGVLFYEARSWFSTQKDEKTEPFPAPFNHEMYMILNLAVGGSWVGGPDETTDFDTAAFVVDYVRVYQKTQ